MEECKFPPENDHYKKMEEHMSHIRIHRNYYIGIAVFAVFCIYLIMGILTNNVIPSGVFQLEEFHVNEEIIKKQDVSNSLPEANKSDVPSEATKVEDVHENEQLPNAHDSLNSLQEANQTNEFSIMTLLITSGRSGSTWIGKLFSLIDDSFYLYEPIHSLGSPSLTTDEYHLTMGFFLVEQLLRCGVTINFAEHARDWNSMYTSKLCSKDNKCVSAESIAEHCHNAKYRTMKIIRLRLGLVEGLLSQKSFKNLKIIFLVRDPRGSSASVKIVQKASKSFNHFLAETLCAKIRDDVYNYEVLSGLYPNNFYFLRYEDMARHPMKKATEMWRFINDNKELEISEIWFNYLKKSQEEKKRIKNPFDIKHKSTQDWQLWRETITEKTYNNSATKCADIIDTLGYQRFESFEEMRDSEESSLSVEMCTSLPCKT